LNILMVSPIDDAMRIQALLPRGWCVAAHAEAEAALDALRSGSYYAVLLGLLDGRLDERLVARLADAAGSLPVVALVTVDDDGALAMRRGAEDFLQWEDMTRDGLRDTLRHASMRKAARSAHSSFEPALTKAPVAVAPAGDEPPDAASDGEPRAEASEPAPAQPLDLSARPVNREHQLRRLSGLVQEHDTDAFVLVREFLSSAPPAKQAHHFRAIERALSVYDFQTAALELHSLMGAGGSVGSS